MDYISFLKNAIRELHGCEPTHVGTVAVTERFKGQTVWDGHVEVFDVPDHPKADKLYAWGYKESDDSPQLKAATVLGVHPITTPRKAVQAFIASQYREQENDAN
jgi:hypothetical protein